MAKIENHKYSIDEAFRECFYIVPDYQREYVWTDTFERWSAVTIEQRQGLLVDLSFDVWRIADGCPVA